jgi:hypothetical protein
MVTSIARGMLDARRAGLVVSASHAYMLASLKDPILMDVVSAAYIAICTSEQWSGNVDDAWRHTLFEPQVAAQSASPGTVQRMNNSWCGVGNTRMKGGLATARDSIGKAQQLRNHVGHVHVAFFIRADFHCAC